MRATAIRLTFVLSAFCLAFTASAQLESNTNDNPFRQLYDVLPTPNSVRTASGAPGHEYWQQQVDYVMDIRLDDDTQRIDGKETITYINNSPDELRYLWLQLDQNMRDLDSDSHMIREGFMEDRMSFDGVTKLEPDFDGGFKIMAVKDAGGKALPYTCLLYTSPSPRD